MVQGSARLYKGQLRKQLCFSGGTSRSEYRLLLRQDNADGRLAALGHALGLVDDTTYHAVVEKYAAAAQEITRLQAHHLPPSDELRTLLEDKQTTVPVSGVSLAALLRRPEISYDDLAPLDPARPTLSSAVKEQVEIAVKYEGYITKQKRQVEAFQKSENRAIPAEVDYEAIHGLRIEARQKLSQVRPQNLGQAGRISGVSPADLTALMIWLEQGR